MTTIFEWGILVAQLIALTWLAKAQVSWLAAVHVLMKPPRRATGGKKFSIIHTTSSERRKRWMLAVKKEWTGSQRSTPATGSVEITSCAYHVKLSSIINDGVDLRKVT